MPTDDIPNDKPTRSTASTDEGGHLVLDPHSEYVQAAAFIVGCLCFDEYVVLDFSDSTSCQNYTNAVRLVAACLYHLRTQNSALPVLPFAW